MSARTKLQCSQPILDLRWLTTLDLIHLSLRHYTCHCTTHPLDSNYQVLVSDAVETASAVYQYGVGCYSSCTPFGKGVAGCDSTKGLECYNPYSMEGGACSCMAGFYFNTSTTCAHCTDPGCAGCYVLCADGKQPHHHVCKDGTAPTKEVCAICKDGSLPSAGAKCPATP
jgi:hypothetical protein